MGHPLEARLNAFVITFEGRFGKRCQLTVPNVVTPFFRQTQKRGLDARPR
jgi:hypothetical protein